MNPAKLFLQNAGAEYRGDGFNRFTKALGPLVREAREAQKIPLTRIALVLGTTTSMMRRLEEGDPTVYPGLYFGAWSIFLGEVAEDVILARMGLDGASLTDHINEMATSPGRRTTGPRP